MTKKDYEKIAQVFRSLDQFTNYATETYSARDAWIDLRNRIATEFAIDNPRFDRQRFYDACYSQREQGNAR